MADNTPPLEGRANLSPGHLSVHVEGAHPAEVLFLFEEQQKRLGPALLVSLVYHAALIAFLVLAYRYGSAPSSTAAFLPQQPNTHIIWLSDPGPGGGGGGGGNKMKEPPRQAELPGRDALTVPVVKPPAPEAPKEQKVDPALVVQLNIPAQTLAAPALEREAAVARAPGRVSVRATEAGRAAACTGRAAASRCRSKCAK